MEEDHPETQSVLRCQKGRKSLSLRTLCSLIIVQKLRRLSDRQVIEQVKENRYIQHFCQVEDKGLETFMHSSSLSRFRTRIGEKGAAHIESMVFKQLCRMGVIETDTALIDSSVLEAHIDYPTDIALLFKALRKMRSIATTHGEMNPWWDMAEVKRLWKAYQMDKTGFLLEWLLKFESYFTPAFKEFKTRYPDEKHWIEIFEILGEQTQAKLQGERWIQHRLVSLDDPDARPIKKGKRFPSCEFGSTLNYVFNRQGFLITILNLVGSPSDKTLYRASLEGFKEKTGQYPEQAVTDRGFRSRANLNYRPEGLTQVFMGCSNDVPPEVQKECHSARSATEGFIAVAKNLRGFRRSQYRGAKGHRVWALLSQTAANLRKFWLLFQQDKLSQTSLEKINDCLA